MKEESEKVGLKLNIQKIMASGPIISWEIDGETVETVSEFFFLGGTRKSLQMVIAAMKLKDAYSLQGVMTNLDSIFKSRDIALPAKARLVKAMVFPVVMYECESWTVKRVEDQRIDAFELWCWISLQSKGLSRVFSNTTVQKH